MAFWDLAWWPTIADGALANARQQLRAAVARACGGEIVRADVALTDANGGVHRLDFSMVAATDATGAPQYLIMEGRELAGAAR